MDIRRHFFSIKITDEWIRLLAAPALSGDIALAISSIAAIRVTIPWSACLSRSCTGLKRQKIHYRFTISFAYTTVVYLSQIAFALKFGLYRSTTSIPSQNFVPK